MFKKKKRTRTAPSGLHRRFRRVMLVPYLGPPWHSLATAVAVNLTPATSAAAVFVAYGVFRCTSVPLRMRLMKSLQMLAAFSPRAAYKTESDNAKVQGLLLSGVEDLTSGFSRTSSWKGGSSGQ